MPALLRMTTCPGAFSAPARLDGIPLPTRLTVMADEPVAWLKLMVSPDCEEKFCQLISARFELWLIFVVLPVFTILALPDVTWPPAGKAKAAGTYGPITKLTAALAARVFFKILPVVVEIAVIAW